MTMMRNENGDYRNRILRKTTRPTRSKSSGLSLKVRGRLQYYRVLLATTKRAPQKTPSHSIGMTDCSMHP